MSRPSRFEQYANLPARLTAFKNTLTLAPLGTLAALLIAYPLAYQLAVRTDPRWKTILLGARHRAVLDQHPDPQLRLDLHPGGQGIPALLEASGSRGCG
jgi:spermidine/putrescine transport system permease protein